MTDQAPTTETIIEAFGAGYLRLYDALHNGDISDAQWMPSHKAVPADDVNIRSRGLISDPVFHTFMDRGRQDLRAAVKEAEKAMRQADAALRHALALLERAHQAQSEDPESAAPATTPPETRNESHGDRADDGQAPGLSHP